MDVGREYDRVSLCLLLPHARPANLVHRPYALDAAPIEVDCRRTELSNRMLIVTDEQDRATGRPGRFVQLADALLLELRVTDGQDFVYQQDVAVEVCRDRERESHCHARRIPLYRR